MFWYSGSIEAATPMMLEIVRRRRDRHAVRVAHAVLADPRAQRIPVERRRLVDLT